MVLGKSMTRLSVVVDNMVAVAGQASSIEPGKGFMVVNAEAAKTRPRVKQLGSRAERLSCVQTKNTLTLK